MKDSLKSWYQASRPPFFIATFIPLAAGWILAGKTGAWHPWRMFFVLLGSFMVHLATNLNNDYFDHIQGTDAGESIGGSRVIQEGKITPRQLITAIVSLYALASIIAFYFLVVLNLWGLFPLIIIAFFSSLFYVAPPVRYGYHGLGEVFCGVSMGPIMVLGTYWVIAERFDWEPLFISIPIGLMVASILYYQSLPDMKTDEAAGKRTLAVKLGKKNAFRGLIIFWTAIYIITILLVLRECLSWFSLVSLATILIFNRLVGIVKRTEDWVKLDDYGRYVRILYFTNGLIIIGGIL